jgi:hypothetical protein
MLDISEQGRQIGGSSLMFRIYFSGSLTTLKSEEKQAPELPTPSFRLKNANNRSQDREVLHATST